MPGNGTPGKLTPMTFEELAELIRALDDRAVDLSDPASPRLLPGRRCRVVGIDGMSGAGKSSFARRLADELAAPVLSVDDLVPGWDALAESVGLLADWVLRPLAAGQQARWRRYDWLAGSPGEWVDLTPGEFLLVEGSCVGLPPASTFMSYLIWIDTPERVRRRRLELRQDWPAYAPFAQRWARQEAALQATADTPARADLVVNNTESRPDGDWADQFTASPRRLSGSA
jgi:hypothetical protein